jgi:glutamyl-tRNA reductase
LADDGQTILFLLGANHRSATVELREALFIAEEPLATLLPAVKERFGFLELAALSTCNRFELMGVAPDRPGLAAALVESFLELHRHHGTVTSRFTEDDVRQAVYLHMKDEAVTHIYRVASSLDSLVLGETQITGQFKDAIALAQKTQTLGPTLSRLSQEALATAKKVRTQTAIGKKHVSISHAAIELAKKVFGDLGDHKFLIVGAGEMSQVAAKYILAYKPKAIYVANRTVANGQALVKDLGFGEAFGMEELPSLLAAADVVLSSTSAPGVVIDAAMVRRAQLSRRGRPLFLLDIALPRDIDPDCGKLDDVYLFDIDDLQQVVGQNYEERRKAAEEAETLIDRSVQQFQAWAKTLAVKPALAAFRGYLDDLIEREAAKTLGREHFRDLTPKQLESLKGLLAAVAGKIAADAARQVLAPPAGYYQEQLADALRILFPEAPAERRKGAS